MNNILIGLSGYARSGKDTVAKILQDKYDITPLSFTTALNDVLLATNPIIVVDNHFQPIRLCEIIDEIGWEKAKDVHPEVRRLQQKLGTDGVRNNISKDAWVQALYNNNKDLIDNGKAAITNVRFPNELIFVREYGGYVIRVVRPGYFPANGHVSDTALDAYGFDAIIKNDGDLGKLEQEVIAVYESLIK